jgi:hypothetical protein
MPVTDDLVIENTDEMRAFLKKLVKGDKRAKQLFYLFYDRGEISEEQFFKAIAR